jgi:hypothetical protein
VPVSARGAWGSQLTCFTCFTGTNVQISTNSRRQRLWQSRVWWEGGTQLTCFTCFTGTNVQISTNSRRQRVWWEDFFSESLNASARVA